jgi:hypothetical protein
LSHPIGYGAGRIPIDSPDFIGWKPARNERDGMQAMQQAL